MRLTLRHILIAGAVLTVPAISIWIATGGLDDAAPTPGSGRGQSARGSSESLAAPTPPDTDSRASAGEAALATEPEPAPLTSIDGVVRTVGGEPVPRASVHSSLGPVAESDDQGHFSLSAGTGEHWLHARAPGLAPVPAPPVRVVDQDVTGIVLTLEPGAELTGVVLGDEGQPLPDVLVSAGAGSSALLPRYARPSPPIEVHTDELGAFRLAPLPTGTVEIAATHPGYLGAGRTIETPAAPIELRLRSLPAVFGTVTLPDGSPAVLERVGVLVSSRDDEGPWRKMDDASGSTSSEDGSFRLHPRSQRRLRLFAEPREGAPVLSEPFWLEDEDVGPLELVAGTGVRLRGSVRSEGGAAIAGALVELSPAQDSDVPGRSPLTSGSDGSFASAPVHEGRYTVRISAPGHLPAKREVQLSSAAATPLDVELAQSASVHGSVLVEGTGSPADLWVHLSSDTVPPRLVRVAQVTGERYELFELPPGAYLLELTDAPPRSASEAPPLAQLTLSLAPGDDLERPLAPQTPLGRWQGQLLVDGAPAPFCRVEARAAAGVGSASCITGADGRYALRGLRPGDYELGVQLSPDIGFVPVRRVTAASMSADESLQIETGTLRMRLLESEAGEAIAGALVELSTDRFDRGQQLPLARGRTSAIGEVSFPGIPAGDVFVSVSAPFRTHLRQERVSVPAGPALPWLDFELAPAGNLSVQVRSNSVLSGTFRLDVSLPNDSNESVRSVERLGPGNLQVEGLARGEARIALHGPFDGSPLERTAWIEIGRTETIFFDL